MKIKLKNVIILASTLLLLFLADWLLKHFLFDWKEANAFSGKVQWDWKVIAGRSLLHKSTTFLDFMHLSIAPWLGQLISWTIFIVIMSIGLFSKTKITAIGMGVILAGVLGNTLDNAFHAGVRDIFFIPWGDRGTFNFADVLVVVGAGITVIAILISIFKSDESVKKSK